MDGGSKHLVLLGPMGAGKTTLGERLARALARPFVDSDAEVESITGMTSAEFAARNGVAALHDLERRVAADALAREERFVIAAAASVLDHPAMVPLLDQHDCVWVDADPETRELRAGQGGTHRRPIGPDEARLLGERRRPVLETVSDVRIDTTEATVDESVAAVIASIAPDHGIEKL